MKQTIELFNYHYVDDYGQTIGKQGQFFLMPFGSALVDGNESIAMLTLRDLLPEIAHDGRPGHWKITVQFVEMPPDSSGG